MEGDYKKDVVMKKRNSQQWTVKKVCCYLVYIFFAKHLPALGELGVIGKISEQLRRNLSRPLFKDSVGRIGVGKGVDFGNGSSVVMGEYSSLGNYTTVSGSRGTLIIGRHVTMGPHSTYILQNHKYLEEGYDGYVGGDINIDDHAWIGHGVIVLPGVRVGCHAIIGAGAVVVEDIPDYAIAVGNPAKVKKYRNKTNQ